MLEPKPQRICVISSMTAFGSTPSNSCMKVPLSSAKGPKDIAFLQPSTSVKNDTAWAHVGNGDAGMVVTAHAGNAVSAD